MVRNNLTWLSVGIVLLSLSILALGCEEPNVEDIKISSIALGENLMLAVGGEETIEPVITPPNATQKTLDWTSSNASVAMVNNGLVTAVAEGGAIITASTRDGSGKFGRIGITVILNPVESVDINGGDFSIVVGGNTPLSVTVLPADAGNKNVTWTSSDSDVASVNSTGLVTAIAAGTATITATAQDGTKKSGSVTVTVNPRLIESITIAGGNFSLLKNETRTLTALITPDLPADAGNQNVTWSSSNDSVARVNSVGLVTAVAEGTATITATAQDGTGKADSVIVTVNPRLIENITIAGGNFSLLKNETRTLTALITPANASNKRIQWESNATGVATVNSAGLVTAIGEGTATITATAADGSEKFGSVTVTVKMAILVESVTIDNKQNFSLVAGWDRILTVTVLPANTTSRVDWSSSNTNVATVNGGVVTALAAGTATITIAAVDSSGKSDSVTVTVTAGSSSMTAQEIFSKLKGQKITTNGWADIANNGAGLSYANPASLTLIEGPSTVTKRTAFTNAINNENAKFIIVSGDIDLSDGKISDSDKSYFNQFNPTTNNRVNPDIRFNLGSNTTLIGINNARLMFGGINISNKSNVIIRNITFYDAHGSTEKNTATPGNSESKASIDAMTIQGGSNGVWVDHCKFTDGTCNDMIRNYNHDGALDIPAGINITVSWTEFTNHDKVMLVAGGDALVNVLDRQITLHHNYFHATTQRMPRTRGTQMHIYNNYYNNIGVSGNSGYCMGPGVNAHFIVENNYFGSIMSNKVVDYYDNATYPAIVWSAGNNKTVDRSPRDNTGGSKPWEPAYAYSLEPNDGLPTSVLAGAGPKLAFRK